MIISVWTPIQSHLFLKLMNVSDLVDLVAVMLPQQVFSSSQFVFI